MLCLKFAKKILEIGNFGHLFPKNTIKKKENENNEKWRYFVPILVYENYDLAIASSSRADPWLRVAFKWLEAFKCLNVLFNVTTYITFV